MIYSPIERPGIEELPGAWPSISANSFRHQYVVPNQITSQSIESIETAHATISAMPHGTSQTDPERPEPIPRMTGSSTSSNSRVRDENPINHKEIGFFPIQGTEKPLDEHDIFINLGDRAELQRLASRTISFTTKQTTNDLERQDTLANIEIGHPTLDPSSPQFDTYKWARMFLRLMDNDKIKSRRAGFVFRGLSVSGSGAALQLQQTVASVLMTPFRLGEFVSFGRKPEKKILRNFNGVVRSGEMLIVLGRPGSGCSTFLKTICGETAGLNLDENSTIHYSGIPQAKMLKEFKGEVIYNQEVDKHFPHLTVGETLSFAAAARSPQQRVMGLSRAQYIEHLTDVVMTVFGLSHTRNTKVGNDFVRGVSGGERKRVSIAEMALAGSPIACWDNSTRGLDAATALEFTKSLKISARVSGACHTVAIYQASQAIYDIFDKAIVLYEGRQIYQGPSNLAKRYFEEMGWYCPPRQTTGDFLTSVTNPQERKPRAGFKQKVPRTPDDFEQYWRNSPEFSAVIKDIERHEEQFPIGGQVLEEFKQSHRQTQAKHMRKGSPYTISVPMQIRLCIKRAYQRIWNDKTSTMSTVFGQIFMSLIVGSVFYGTATNTGSFFSKGAILFFAVLLNALLAITEINNLYDQRPIIEKQASYAFCHPFAEALAGIISDIPIKLMIAVCFNIILYFLGGLRPEPSQFFIFFLFVFVAQLTMTAIFRTVAAATKTLSQALSIAGVLVLAVVIYTGFTIPRPYMHPWFKWISWINPIAYAFEALLVNEVHGRQFPCSSIVPSYPNLSGDAFICSVAGSVAGQTSVSGDSWVQSSYGYSYAHIWRNLGFMFAFMVFFLATYLVATEFNSSTSSTAEVLVFRRGHVSKAMQQVEKSVADSNEGTDSQQANTDGEKAGLAQAQIIAPQEDVFTWKDIVYDIKIKGEPRRLLDHVSGWVKPGTLTALMGVSGAGKTTLLDVLAHRTSVGVITGDMLVNGKPLDASFQRKTGYVQQQDLHLETSTVREALRFSAVLRQPNNVPKIEKYAFVEDVIKMLNMEEFSEAVVGQPGEGLNVQQRKLLTIGVELAAKPALLLFLDEPTSGLDSQSSWAIVAFLRKLADNGQAVLSTIHQPSSILFQEFDRLLFLAKGGRTVYFGDIGPNSEILLEYFQSHGSRRCDESENPAEFMLEVVGAGATGKSTQDWHDVWRASQKCKDGQNELEQMHMENLIERSTEDDTAAAHSEFAMPFRSQLYHVTVRVFQQYWRTPTYVWGKLLLGIMSALFIGFSFWKSDSSQQGLQDVIFSVFMLTTIFSTLVQQIMPRFVTQRSLYEIRERPSKAYSWAAFLIANIMVEIPYQALLGLLVYGAYYYPIYGIQSSERQGLILLFCIQFFIFASTFAHALIAALPDSATAGNIATLLFSMTLIFNGVMQPPQALPGFWLFMYRVSPLTYIIDGIAATGMHAKAIVCAPNELIMFNPPIGQSCGDYMSAYLSQAPGNLLDPGATNRCEYCPLSHSDQFLANVAINWDLRWRNFGIVWAYVVFNIACAVLFYYMFRVKKWSGGNSSPTFSKLLNVLKQLGRAGRKLTVKMNETVPNVKEDLEEENLQ